MHVKWTSWDTGSSVRTAHWDRLIHIARQARTLDRESSISDVDDCQLSKQTSVARMDAPSMPLRPSEPNTLSPAISLPIQAPPRDLHGAGLGCVPLRRGDQLRHRAPPERLGQLHHQLLRRDAARDCERVVVLVVQVGLGIGRPRRRARRGHARKPHRRVHDVRQRRAQQRVELGRRGDCGHNVKELSGQRVKRGAAVIRVASAVVVRGRLVGEVERRRVREVDAAELRAERREQQRGVRRNGPAEALEQQP
eukprot:5380349-Pleurochrysis_carterae.AAC.3